MTLALHDYQRVAVDWLRGRDRAALFLDMGLGKTAATLSALEPRHLPVLVVAPKRVAENVWHREARKWRPDLRLVTVAGNRDTRAKLLVHPKADVVVISRDNLRDVTAAWPRGDHPFKTVVLDELSSFKSRGSVRWKTARKIVKGVDYRWGLTGTPSPNGLMDLWAQIALLDDGKRLGTTLTSYRNRYFFPGRQLANGVITEWIPRPEAPTRIHRLLEDIAISMETDGRLDLPPTTVNRVDVPLDPVVRRHYKRLKKDLVLQMDLVQHYAPTAAALSNQLSQMTAGFLYQKDEITGETVGATEFHRNKIRAVEEIAEGTGSPLLVFYRYHWERDALLTLDGAEPFKGSDVVDRWNAGKIPILVAHPAAIGHGLNLQDGGHTIVWTTATWALEEWEQSNKRLNRQGQTRPVVIHVLVSPGTVDEVVLKALEQKASVQDALLDHLESPL